MEIREKAQAQIHDLYNDLMEREQTPALIDITDVLLQVYKKLDTVKNPEVWVNRLVNYIYIVGKASNVGFNRQEEAMLIALGDISKLAGWNGGNRAAFNDKMQFYGPLDPKPARFP